MTCFFHAPLHGTPMRAHDIVCTLHGPGDRQSDGRWWVWWKSQEKDWADPRGSVERNSPRSGMARLLWDDPWTPLLHTWVKESDKPRKPREVEI